MKQFSRNGGFTRFQINRKEETSRVLQWIGATNNLSGSLSGYVAGSNLTGNQIAYYSASGLTGNASLVYGSNGTVSGARFYVSNTTPVYTNELASKSYVDANIGTGSFPATGSTNNVAVFSSSSTLSGYQALTYSAVDGLRVTNNIQSYTSTASSSSIALGVGTTANNKSIAIGDASVASGLGSVAVGLSAHATSESSVAIGDGTTASAQWATALGTNTLASGLKSTALGFRSKASRTAQFALANNGYNGNLGWNQFSIITQYVQTTDATQTIIAYDPNQYTMLLEDNTVYSLTIMVAAKATSGNQAGIWNFRSAVRRLSGASTVSIISNNRFADVVPLNSDCNIAVDTTYGALNVLATGRAGYTFNWSCTIMFTEVHT